MTAPQPPRVLIARLYHETHGFLDDDTPAEAFTRRSGAALLSCRGDGSTLDGALEAAERLGWEVVPAVDYAAMPSGPVTGAAFEAFWTELAAVLRQQRGRLDALYLILHGCMATRTRSDIEGELLRRIRASEGTEHMLIFGVYDLHATFTDLMAEGADALVAYRECPHTDARERAAHVAGMLDAALRAGQRPRMVWRHAGIIWPPLGTATADRPMSLLQAEARRLEQRHEEFLAVSVNAGFAYADSPDAGVSFAIATTGDDATCSGALDGLVDLARRHEQDGFPPLRPVRDVLKALQPGGRGPVILVEAADNIGAGAEGREIDVLRAMVEQDVQGGAVIINDPDGVAMLAAAPVGAVVRHRFKATRFDGGADLMLDVRVVSRSDGRFRLHDPHSHLASMQGDRADMGPCAVLRHRGTTMLLTSRKLPPFDLGQWISQGLDPAAFSVIAVKAAVAHRQAYDPIASASHIVDTPGPCPNDLRQIDRVRKMACRGARPI
jgi:microcystin degradation protein MlrC